MRKTIVLWTSQELLSMQRVGRQKETPQQIWRLQPAKQKNQKKKPNKAKREKGE